MGRLEGGDPYTRLISVGNSEVAGLGQRAADADRQPITAQWRPGRVRTMVLRVSGCCGVSGGDFLVVDCGLPKPKWTDLRIVSSRARCPSENGAAHAALKAVLAIAPYTAPRQPRPPLCRSFPASTLQPEFNLARNTPRRIVTPLGSSSSSSSFTATTSRAHHSWCRCKQNARHAASAQRTRSPAPRCVHSPPSNSCP